MGNMEPVRTGDGPAAVVGLSRSDATKEGDDGTPDLDAAIALAQAIVQNLGRVLLGTPDALTAAAIAALSGGHLLIEDVPGVGKTVLARALATSLGAEFSRIQGHPDLLASDVTGISVYSPETASWEFRPGPVFAHVVLCDELNRTPPRTQSALLETMEEQQVSVDGESWPLETQRFCSSTVSPVNAISRVDSGAMHGVGSGIRRRCDKNL
jgi:MoxR-like ATPase